jgi:hypothetical protein
LLCGRGNRRETQSRYQQQREKLSAFHYRRPHAQDRQN